MKRLPVFAVWLAMTTGLMAQNPNAIPVVDPTDAFVDAVSLGEFESAGDDEGWTSVQVDNVEVTGGSWTGTTSGEDPSISLTLPDFLDVFDTPRVYLEFRMKRSAGDASPVQIFWADVNGGFAEGRSITILPEHIVADDQFHVYRVGIWGKIAEYVEAIRIDFSIEAGWDVAVDYIRVRAEESGYTLTVDPPENARVNFYTSLAEFNTPDDLEGWGPSPHVGDVLVAGGILSGVAIGNDAILNRGGLELPFETGEHNILEIRLKRDADDGTRVDVFIFDEQSNYSEQHKFTVGGGEIPPDGEFHILQFDATKYFAGTLHSLRIDPTSDETGRSIAIDYIRLGIISPDGDGDGLADAVETGTGTFVDLRDTGTNPANPDTDGDGYTDGVEVTYGTNPNDPNSKPSASFDGYSSPNPVYVIDFPATENNPVISNGTPTGYSVSPALPAGLSLNPTTGAITGTPTALAAQATYTFTVSFSDAPDATFEMSIAVSNPGITGYALNPAVYKAGQNISENTPRLIGPPPDDFTVSPELPIGLFLDSFTGAIAGFAEEATPTSDYTVTASYAGYPDASFVVTVTINPAPVLTVDPETPITHYESLAEFDFDEDPEGWEAYNTTLTVQGGIGTQEPTGTDPIIAKGGLFYDMTTDDYSILEFRLRRSDHDQRFQIFWSDDSGGEAEERSFIIQPGDFPPLDDEFHVYQIAWPGVLNTTLLRLRIDDGDGPGRTGEFDYIRIGRIGTVVPPVSVPLDASLVGDDAIAVRWPVGAPAGLVLQSAASLAGPWAAVTTAPFVENNQNVVVEAISGPTRFYRLRQP